MSNLFAALDSDSEDDRAVAKKVAPKKQEPAAAAPAKRQPRNDRGRGGRGRGRGRGRDDRGRGRGGRGGSYNRTFDGSRNNNNRGARDFSTRGPPRDRRADKGDNRKRFDRDRRPRNGPGDKRAMPKKGGAGGHNWGTGLEEGDVQEARAAAGDGSADPEKQDDEATPEGEVEGETEPEEPEVIEMSLEEYQAKEAERRQNKAAFAQISERKVSKKDMAGYGQVMQKEEDKVPEESGKYKQNRRKHAGHNKEKHNVAAEFFKSAPRRRDDDGGGRGRGRGYGRGRGGDSRGRGRGGYDDRRGRGGRGRGGYDGGRGRQGRGRGFRSFDNRNGSRGSQVPKTTDMSEFPSLG